MGLISLAALVDPFGGLPPVSEVWADCEGDCALAHRFPGFWRHVVLTLVHLAAAATVLFGLAAAVAALRDGRATRFASVEEAARYAEARRAMAGFAVAGAVLAAAPIVVALA